MDNRYEVGKSLKIPEGTELNHGLNEDSDSITLPKGIRATIVSLAHLKDGGIEIAVPGHGDWSPLFWHQPEVSNPARS